MNLSERQARKGVCDMGLQHAYGFNIGEIVIREYGNDNSLFKVKGFCLQSILIEKSNSKPMYVHYTGLRHATKLETLPIVPLYKESPEINNESSGNKLRIITTELGIEKLCTHCREYYPMDEEFFWSNGNTLKDGSKGFCSVCKACHKELYKRKKVTA